MLKKKLIIPLAVAAALAVSVTGFAATSDTGVAHKIRGAFGLDTTKLTDAQKADVSAYSQKMADLQKEFIDKMVTNGSLTQEQGDAQKAQIDERLKSGDALGMLGGRGGKGGEAGKGGMMMDTSKLTDAQKADLAAGMKNIVSLQKEEVAALVTAGILTQEQADKFAAQLDKAAAEIDAGTAGFGRGLMGFPMPRGNNLTEEQKAVLQTWQTKLTEAHKALTDKLVADGVLTQDQADRMSKGPMGGMMNGGKGFDRPDGQKGQMPGGKGGRGHNGSSQNSGSTETTPATGTGTAL